MAVWHEMLAAGKLDAKPAARNARERLDHGP